MEVPYPTRILRLTHVDNLQIYLSRNGMHAPNHFPNNGLEYKTIHNIDIQQHRRIQNINCGLGGVIHDYVSFYFGPRSPMLYQLHTGWVNGYNEGQEPLIYLISTAQDISNSNIRFVFSDGHGIARFTTWYDDLKNLDKIDWEIVYTRIWKDDVEDMDRQRRKQAEFLVYQFCPWTLIKEITVINTNTKSIVENILNDFPDSLHRPVIIKRNWYY